MYLVIDTETNGKIKDFKTKLSKDTLDNFPRIAQIGFAVFDEDEVCIKRKSIMIKPDGWEIPKEKFFIDNNMSTERCEKEGYPIELALDKLIYEIEQCEYVIAHNMSFDYPVIGAELIRLGLKSENKPIKICTMMSSIDFCDLPRKKFPKLEELYFKLFKSKMTEVAHDALGDVMTCASCFFELKRLGIIK